MTTIQISSMHREGVEHTLYIHNGKAVGCNCDEAKAIHTAKYNFKPCRHMKRYNRTPLSCELCGQLTYSSSGICYKHF